MPQKISAMWGRGGTSSSSQPSSSEVDSAVLLSQMLTFTHHEANKRYERLGDLSLGTHKFIDMDTLRTLHLEADVNDALSVGKFHKLFDIKEPSHRELVLEFLCTLSVDVDLRHKLPSKISFRAYTVPYTIDMRTFSRAMGIYTDAEMDAPEFANLIISEGVVNEEEYWRSISDDGAQYIAWRSKASHLHSSAMRYLHKVMAHTISGRDRNPGAVNRRDLYHIWSMLEHRPVHIAQSILFQLYHQVTSWSISTTINGGFYVTKLIKGLRLLREIPGMTISNYWEPVNIPTLIQMHMIEIDYRTRAFYIIRDRGDPTDDPPPASVQQAYCSARRPVGDSQAFTTVLPSSSSVGHTLEDIWNQQQELVQTVQRQDREIHSLRRTQRRQDSKLDAILANLANMSHMTGDTFIDREIHSLRRTQRRQDSKLDTILANLANMCMTRDAFIEPVCPLSSNDDSSDDMSSSV